MSYTRVVPRDLFNESKLLKCIGQLILLIHDDLCSLMFEHDGSPFDIQQDESDGSIFVNNVQIYTLAGRKLHITTSLNSRRPYPCYASVDDKEVAVFHDDGALTADFEDLINRPES